MQAHQAAFILAGGPSSRMGRDKALLELRGVPLILRISRLVESVLNKRPVIIGLNEPYRNLGLRVVEDGWSGAGPFEWYCHRFARVDSRMEFGPGLRLALSHSRLA